MKYILALVPCLAFAFVGFGFSPEVRGYPLWVGMLPLIGVYVVFISESIVEDKS